MKERPILFNGAMVRALLDGSKTQTRRLVKGFQIPKIDAVQFGPSYKYVAVAQNHPRYGFCVFGPTEQACADKLAQSGCCPFGKVGDQLWVRETWRTDDSLNDKAPSMFSSWPVKYEADGKRLAHGAFHGNTKGKTRASIHMPRWASRIQLEITGVRVERLHDISEEDALAEGSRPEPCDHIRQSCDDIGCYGNTAKSAFRGIWESTGGNWDDNPWVWAIDFKQVAA